MIRQLRNIEPDINNNFLLRIFAQVQPFVRIAIVFIILIQDLHAFMLFF